MQTLHRKVLPQLDPNQGTSCCEATVRQPLRHLDAIMAIIENVFPMNRDLPQDTSDMKGMFVCGSKTIIERWLQQSVSSHDVSIVTSDDWLLTARPMKNMTEKLQFDVTTHQIYCKLC